MQRLLLFVLMAVVAVSCRYEEVSFEEIRHFKIQKVEAQKIHFSFDARIVNPNAYALKVSDTDLKIEVNGVNLGQLYLSENLKIPAGNNDFLAVDASVQTAETAQGILSIVLGSVFSRAVDLRLTGEVKGGLLFFPKRIPVDHSERIEWNGTYSR